MLPSTGYFKGINCPFYDSGLCERPYCHFRHAKKDIQNNSDGIESGAILQKLVSAAVQKVLQQSDPSGAVSSQPAVGDNVVNSLNTAQSLPKATYNPTPISELKKISNTDLGNNDDSSEQRKRHIPVPYTPRKPASISIKRLVESDDVSKPFIYNPPPVKYTPGLTETVQLDPYTPKGTVESKEKYLPGKEIELPEYTPKETLSSTKVSYVPSDKSSNKKKIVLEYKPVKVTAKKETSFVTYQPTPRSLVPCFSSDEDEPKNKKRKLSNDLNGFDDLGPEFDILDEILDEETPKPPLIDLIEDKKKLQDSKLEIQNKVTKNPNTEENVKKEKSSSRSEKSRDKNKLSDKSKISTNKKDKRSRSNESSDKKSSHKSSHKDKSKEDKHKKSSSKKKKQSSPQRTDRNTKYIEKETKKSDKHSQHQSSSRSSSKKENKSNYKKSHKSSKESKDKHKKYKTKESFSNNTLDDDSNPIEDDIIINKNEEDLYESSESDEEAITLECKKIFEEYVPIQKIIIEDKSDKIDDVVINSEYIPSKKRVSRTVDKNIKVIPRASVKPDYKVNAAQAMAERLAKVKEFHAAKGMVNSALDKIPAKIETHKNTVHVEPPKNTYSTPSAGSKIRIAHVPYASTLMNAKRTISSNSNAARVEASTSSTIVQTVKKGVQRVAHMPNEKFIDRPGVLEPLASKIAANIRSTYLNMMIDECLKIYLTPADAYARAQHEELTTSKKCSTVQIYKNSAVLAVSRLRKELLECNGVKKSGIDCLTLQKIPKAVSGTTGNAGSWSIENKNWRVGDTSQEFNGAKLYQNISKWILDEQQLQDNGFPRPHPSGEKGRAMIYGQKKQVPPRGFIRTCCRCKKDYTVDKKGLAAVKAECIYHPNNKYRVRGEVRYQCCSQDGTSDGCCIAPSHVYEYVNYENLKGYVRTFPPEREMDDYGVYSLDCEMCYTTQGLDLTRITVINSSCKVIYETLIRPLHPIIDYNTRYSGITEEQMSNVKTTLLEVQATLLSMFNSKTILIGHSLESDFKALKLIHDTVIDTSVLFPHKMGPPFKRALRNLSSEYLKKIIQNSVEGHDSAEDATVCMELIHFKLKEDLKTR